MANTVQIKLLENKTAQALWNGRPIEYEGGYKIIAGEENATQFELANVPKDYEECSFDVTGYDAAKEVVQSFPSLKKGEIFTLPKGMAVAGYSSLVFRCTKGSETVYWIPIKLKVSNTSPDWYKDAVIPFESFLKMGEEAEQERQSNENERKAAEQERQSNELERQLAEETREMNEEQRKSAEEQRKSNEINRTTAEEQRETNFQASKDASNEAADRANTAADNINKILNTLEALPYELEVKAQDGSKTGISVLRFVEF